MILRAYLKWVLSRDELDTWWIHWTVRMMNEQSKSICCPTFNFDVRSFGNVIARNLGFYKYVMWLLFEKKKIQLLVLLNRKNKMYIQGLNVNIIIDQISEKCRRNINLKRDENVDIGQIYYIIRFSRGWKTTLLT